jgi:hypothetical protein
MLARHFKYVEPGDGRIEVAKPGDVSSLVWVLELIFDFESAISSPSMCEA